MVYADFTFFFLWTSNHVIQPCGVNSSPCTANSGLKIYSESSLSHHFHYLYHGPAHHHLSPGLLQLPPDWPHSVYPSL